MRTLLTILASMLLPPPLWLHSAETQRGEMFGYLLFGGERVAEEFNAGFSLYAAAWPLVGHYPGRAFQTGLLSTWMHPQYQPGQKPAEKCYTDIEGGLGWWRDTRFPTTTPEGQSVLLHRHSVYTKAALWDDVECWFAGGPAAEGVIKSTASATQTFKAGGGSTWKLFPLQVPRQEAGTVAWKSFATFTAPDPLSRGLRWNEELTRRKGPLVTLPEFFRLGQEGDKPLWSVVSAHEVPEELGLTQYRFETPPAEPWEPRTTPEDPESCWKTPGPAAGPFRARLGDGSVVTYYWYRFADQPAMLNADLTPAEREVVQRRVEMLHRAWTKDRDYLAPPHLGRLAGLDPALILTPPPGLGVGYVPIATRQELETKL